MRSYSWNNRNAS